MKNFTCPFCDAPIGVEKVIQKYAEHSKLKCPTCQQLAKLEISHTSYFVSAGVGSVLWVLTFLVSSSLGYQQASLISLCISVVGLSYTVWKNLFKLIRA